MSYNNQYNNPYSGGSQNPYASAGSNEGYENPYASQGQPQQPQSSQTRQQGSNYGNNSSHGSQGGYAQQQQQSNYGQAAYGQQGHANPYGASQQQQQQQQQPSSYQKPSSQGTRGVNAGTASAGSYELSGDKTDFFSQTQSIKDDLSDYNNLIGRLQNLQTKSLGAVGSDEVSSIQAQIDSTTTNLEDLQSNQIKPKLQTLYKSCGSDADKQKQAENLTQQFRSSITKLAKIEDGYNQSNINKAVDQYKIVNPQATDDQARDFIDESGNQQVFDNAIAQSNRKGEAMTVLQEVQARHQEVQRTEKMAAELNQLFAELQGLVFEQDQQFDAANENIAAAQDNLEKGDANVIKARDKAKKTRKWKWILFWIVVIIICAIVGGVVGGILGNRK